MMMNNDADSDNRLHYQNDDDSNNATLVNDETEESQELPEAKKQKVEKVKSASGTFIVTDTEAKS